jgi:hypothetical protein
MLDPANGLRRTRMVYLITKALISGVIIMAASEVVLNEQFGRLRQRLLRLTDADDTGTRMKQAVLNHGSP